MVRVLENARKDHHIINLKICSAKSNEKGVYDTDFEYALQGMLFNTREVKVIIYVQAYSKLQPNTAPRSPFSRKDIVNGDFKGVEFTGSIIDIEQLYHNEHYYIADHLESRQDHYIELCIELDDESSKRWYEKVNRYNLEVVA